MGLLEPGSSFGKYRVVRRIGRGGMGIVYLAEDQDLGRRVALKVLDRSITSDEHFEERFRQEARIIAGLDHPNIVQIHHLERVGDDLAIDMTYVESGSLADAMAEDRLMVQDVLSLVQDVLGALSACHEAGIVHRDIKPSNILLTNDSRALVSDFGLAKLMADYHESSILNHSSSSLFVGTPRYAPPESWDDQEPAPSWDVYATGMVLYEAIACENPYTARTPFALMKQMIERPLPKLHDILPEISEALSDLVAAMLDSDPAKRPADGGAALRLLEQVPELQGADTGGSTIVRRRVQAQTFRRPSKRSARIRRKKRLQQGIIGLIAGVMLLGIMATGMALWRMRTQQETHSPNKAHTAIASGEVVTGAEPYLLFNSIDPSTHEIWPDHWLMLPGKRKGEWKVLASHYTDLWMLDASLENDMQWTFKGGFGEYTDGTAAYFRHGEVKGTGRWVTQGAEMTVSLEFHSLSDAWRGNHVLTLKRSDNGATDVEFLRKLEGEDLIQPLLYNELFVRHVPWAEPLETQFLGRTAQRVKVLPLSPSEGLITLDGRLEEPAWKTLETGTSENFGALRGQPPEIQATLRVRYDANTLYIGLETGKALSNAILTLYLMNQFAIPAPLSQRWGVQVSGNGTVTGQCIKRGQRVEWNCAWQAAERTVGDRWQAEIAVPFANVSTREAVIPGDRWRINCTISTKTDQTPLAVWGGAPVEAVEQGVILLFSEH
ncbi:MAG TPA: protein kinase [Candidatus Hydrogenedentes bacterium]|nr:protein kinase [Candidatus Hydrogenedentota bacterium]